MIGDDRERAAWGRVAGLVADAALLGAVWLAVVTARAAIDRPGWPSLSAEVGLPAGWLVVPIWLAATARATRPAEVARGVGAAVLGTLVLLFLSRIPVNRSVLLGFAGASVPALIAWRWSCAPIARWWRRRARRRVAVIGDRSVDRWAEHLARDGVVVVHRLTLDAIDQLEGLVARAPVDEVKVGGGWTADALAPIARACEELGLPWSVDASFLGPRTASVALTDADGWAVVTFRAGSDGSPERLVKRVVDGVGAVVGLIALGPLILAVMAAVRLADGGPALYHQRRIGRFGRPFTIWKIRTMAVDAPPGPGWPLAKPTRDPRITPLGRALRRSSLDELPQLVNVLRGEMSLVGPRPPLPDEVARYQPWQRRRLSVRPGITGLWQVSGRADLPTDRWIELDLQYVDRWSLWLDLVVLARTVPAVLGGAGAR